MEIPYPLEYVDAPPPRGKWRWVGDLVLNLEPDGKAAQLRLPDKATANQVMSNALTYSSDRTNRPRILSHPLKVQTLKKPCGNGTQEFFLYINVYTPKEATHD